MDFGITDVDDIIDGADIDDDSAILSFIGYLTPDKPTQ